MNVEGAHKQEMLEYIKSAIYYLEMAANVVECDVNLVKEETIWNHVGLQNLRTGIG